MVQLNVGQLVTLLSWHEALLAITQIIKSSFWAAKVTTLSPKKSKLKPNRMAIFITGVAIPLLMKPLP